MMLGTGKWKKATQGCSGPAQNKTCNYLYISGNKIIINLYKIYEILFFVCFLL